MDGMISATDWIQVRFQIYSVVRKHTLQDFIILKSIEIHFMTQYMFYSVNIYLQLKRMCVLQLSGVVFYKC